MTLAFTPYGSDPGKLVERARAQHHEVLLQIPMEPFDYPNSGPGPQTHARLGRRRVEISTWSSFWHFGPASRAMSASSNSHGQALRRHWCGDASLRLRGRQARARPIFDDRIGGAQRSRPTLAEDRVVLPFARADLAIDTVPTSIEIDQALSQAFEGGARDHGTAVGMASALPISIERVNLWARALASHGIVLVPLTTVMLKSKSS